MKTNIVSRALALPVVAATALVASPAFAQAVPSAETPDFSGLTTAVTGGLGAGIGLMLTFAPSIVMLAVTWMLINRARAAVK